MLYNVAPTFEYVNEILTCDHSNESYRAVLSLSGGIFAICYNKEIETFFKSHRSECIKLPFDENNL